MVIWHFVGGHPLLSINRGLTASSNAPESSYAGFAQLIEPNGANPRTVLIVGPINCPRPAGVRCTSLAAALDSAGVPYARTEQAQFSPSANLDGDKLSAVMNNDPPIVFINGMAKANPSADEVIEAYNAIIKPAPAQNKVY